jgi:outer membrane biosynthesis protein TonB
MPEPEPDKKAASAGLDKPVADVSAPVIHLRGTQKDPPLPDSVAAGILADMALIAVTPPRPPSPPPAPEAEPPTAALSEEEVSEPAFSQPEPAAVEPAPPPAPEPVPTDESPSSPPPPVAPGKRDVPKYEWPKARPPEEPEPPPPPAPARTPLGEILVLYLSALLAILAVGLLLYLEMQRRERDDLIARELVSLREAVDALESRSTPDAQLTTAAPDAGPQPLDFPTNDGTIDAILALQARVNALEKAAQDAEASSLPKPSPITTSRTQLLDEPTSDCIPIETRFLALTGEAYPICRTPEVIKLTNITADSVTTDNGANVVEGGFTRLAFGNCTLLVISADIEGFAEMRVTCS